MALSKLSIFYKWKNIKKLYKNNKFKTSETIWDKEFELPDKSYSMSDIQDYFKCINKKHETLIDKTSVEIYVNRMQNRVIFKIKIGYCLEL